MAPAGALLPVVVQADTTPAPAAPEVGEAASESSRPERSDRPEGERGERSGRRSRRGGRRRRREPGEPVGATESGGGEGTSAPGNEAGPEPQSFDFERAASPPAAPAARPEWTPGPPSDATREGPRSEP